MKVDSLSNSIKSQAPNSITSKQARTPDVNGSPVNASSSVEITQSLLKLKSSSHSKATFNSEKVNQIKAAIEEGRFEINSGAIADSLIATANDLLNTQSIKR
jgi:negative regulator of flagellin synthesis FlgM